MKHLIVGPAGHGVTEYALGLARTTGAEVIREETFGDTPLAGPVHVTFTDHLFGDTAERLLARIDGPLSVSLHDIPQPEEGAERYDRRAGVYRGLVEKADVAVVNSEHEASFFDIETTVIRLPIPVIDSPFDPEPGSVGVLGFLYPGKGHEDLIAALPDRRLRFLGAVSHGHETWAQNLDAEITGWLTDTQLAREMGRIAVPVCPHRHFSASGSLMTWLGAGRTVLVRDSAYAREIDAWLPGRVTLVADGGWGGAVDKHVPEQLDPPRYGWAEVAQKWEETWRLAGLM
ncbi:glycosyltransferase family 1 protein [Corynebacterium lehmanniae]|uniref:Glycosyltransferase family 1 protein n=1 Tax=Corynebacterium lehmanniae TaxID=2913497 RepID=A0ABT4RBB0_9CORY|nr:glycosyltransferase family 1 protein [Corynebacterium lehmanniae]MCZ9292648.1 glycosyltransferase family 1 protein [Corynebacterium lehmanniae]